MYSPPFEITSEMINYISRISEKIGEINSRVNKQFEDITLRKENRIKTIHSSLAIENNTLTLDQITAIINGKKVLGKPNEIQEVQNAIEAYDLMLSLSPYEEKDLLKAHQLMMKDLVSENGKYRSGAVGIFDGDKLVHMAPPAKMVPKLMSDLFEWIKLSDVHPLIKSSVFHYEFEFIHPFQDGNGRMGRLWQTVILKDWQRVFAWIPVETLIKENQENYYKFLSVSDKAGKCNEFISFMLSLIEQTIDDIIEGEKVTAKVTAKVTVNQQKILDLVEKNPYITQEELATAIGITRKSVISNMNKLKDMGMIIRTGADKNGYWELEI